MDQEAEMDLIRQKIMAALGVSEEMLTGPTTYATSSISAKPLTVEDRRRSYMLSISRSTDLVTGKVTRDKYVKANLASEMRKHRGKKRLRKKKAKAALRQRLGFLQLGRMLSRRVNYSEIGRKILTVEPLPLGVGVNSPSVPGTTDQEAP
tara:strand:- start:1058 stop:1507 length:450 start_codon:yes stop_codon:yes gene_type:complete